MKHIRTMMLSIILALCTTSSFAALLSYDQASGMLSGFSLNTNDTPTTPSSYAVSTEYWSNTGFIGRLLYQGNPTTFSISNIGPIASFTTNGWFYFTYNTNGSTNIGSWREFFLVARPKGLTQGGSQYDFSGINSVISNNGGSFVLTQGAGTELVEIGETGYDTNMQSGVYTGTNAYKYKYPFSYIWIDLTLIRTQNSRNLTRGYYESIFSISTTNGLNYQLNLGAEFNPKNSQAEPFSYYFGIEETAAKPFLFSALSSRNTVANALPVATLRFAADMSNAAITISSDSAGMQDSFYFTSNGVSFPFHVAFDPSTPDEVRTQVTVLNNTFTSVSTSISSPVGGTYSAYRLEGDICLFVDQDLYPVSGDYNATIYVSITQIN